MKKTLLSILGLLCFVMIQAQVAKTLHMTTAGTLSGLLTTEEKNSITDLTLSGPVDARDFKTIRDHMPSILVLDMAKCNITAFRGSGGTENNSSAVYEANKIPQYAFSDSYGSNYKSKIRSFIFPEGINSIGNYAFHQCQDLSGNLDLPSSLTSIGEGTFDRCKSLTGDLALPSSLTSIGKGAFSQCSSLNSVVIPAGITVINDYTFWGCRSFTSVAFHDGIISIGNSAFDYCDSLPGELRLPASLQSIGESAFMNCPKLNQVIFPQALTSIGGFAFSECTGLTSIQLPDGLISIGESAFFKCAGLTSIQLPEGLTSIGKRVFYNCSGLMGELKLPAGLTSVPEYAFSGCTGLTSIQLPDGLTSIGESAFSRCSGLTGELQLPAALTSIGGSAFKWCSGLFRIRSFAPNPPVIKYDSFDDKYLKIVFVPKGSTLAYKLSDGWRNFTIIDEESEFSLHISSPGTLGKSIVEAGGKPNMVTRLILSGELNDDDFMLMKSSMPLLYSVDLKGLSNTSIPDNAFSYKAPLLDIILPSGLTVIGNSAFRNCTGLTSIDFPSGVTSIESYAFSECSELTGQIKLPDGLVKIGNAAFLSCSGLTSIDFPSGLTSIGDSAFYECSDLTNDFIFPAGLTSIGKEAFYWCVDLTGDLILPVGLTMIAPEAFCGCRELTGIHFKKNVKHIGDRAFSGCEAVSKITNESVTPSGVGNDVFEEINPLTCELYVPQGSRINYLLAPQWGAFSNIIEMDVPADNYLATFNITKGGTVSCNGASLVNGSKLEVSAGESVKLIIIPSTGYVLEQILFDGEDVTSQVENSSWSSPGLNKAVVISVSFKIQQYEVTILTVGSGAMNAHIVDHNSTHTYRLAASEGYLIECITLNGTDITSDLVNEKLTLHAISQDETIVITSKQDGETSNVGISSDKTIRTWTDRRRLFVESAEMMTAVEAINMGGQLVNSISKSAYIYILDLPEKGIYVIRLRTAAGEVKTVKVAI